MSVIRKSVWLLPISNSHIFDHKYLFAPPILRPQYTPIAYPSQIGAQYNATLTIPPHRATFPAEVQTYQVNNHHWQYQRYWGCQSHQLHQYIFPCGDFEVSLLNIRPPTYTQDFCQKLPDLENPYHSYTQAASLIQKRMAINHTWYSWPTLHANTTQPSISLQQLFGNYSMAELISDYQQLTPAVTYYRNKLRKTQLQVLFDNFQLQLFKQLAFSSMRRQCNQQMYNDAHSDYQK